MTGPAAYEIRRSRIDPLPVIASIPHAGLWISDSVRDALAPGMDRLPITDWYIDRLYDFLPQLGVMTVIATANRFVADANRDPDAKPLYPGRFETGLVPLTTFAGETVFAEPPAQDAIEARRLRWHAPYHAAIARLLDEALGSVPRVLLLDLHSVASGANRLHGALEDEIYLGNRDDTSCRPEILAAAQDAFETAGLSVSVNAPYKGGYTTDHYGRKPGVDALQIEMCQRVYMDEAEPDGAWQTARFAAARTRIKAVFGNLLPRVVSLLG